ncbi:hypothetical protein K438DRAFT_1907684 [Mycena galopus ATCC 62051]|nr:hypothetical protein K438DRAFT_1631296 [Mycena galopus ATCC 62051]KAF8185568.1 hypothetical protein K438DRAFT_1907684 [Mycena galopus ATCC 62051]
MFFFKLTALGVSSIAGLAAASPALLSRKTEGCDTSKAVMDLPPNQTALVAPATAPLFILVGVGVQNYTCSGTTYTSIGAVASLFDISCLSHTQFATVQTTAYNIWEALPVGEPSTCVGPLVGAPHLDGFHYFVTSPSGTGISPKWDFTSTGKFAGDPNAYVIGAKVGNIPAPTNPATNVDWLALNRVEGDLASEIFRIDTVGGQPPTSCVAGSAPISVKYTAKYYLY